MFTPRPRGGARLHTAARLGRLAVALAAITCAGLVSAASAWAAPVVIPIPPGGPAVPAPAVRVVTAGGMAGWQITVIAVGAALVAAIAAVALDRARAARKAAPATAVPPGSPRRQGATLTFMRLRRVRPGQLLSGRPHACRQPGRLPPG